MVNRVPAQGGVTRANDAGGGGGGGGGGSSSAVLPPHQAVMVLEPRNDYAFRNESFRYAINTGDDGDLSKGWELLPGHQYHESGPTVPDQLDLGAPSVHFDDEEGYYYTIGGGSITAGPVRSKTLQAGSWELSPRAPMAPPAAETAKVGLAALDNRVYRGFYVDVWERETLDDRTNIAAYLANITRWNYGVTDPDFCCSDGKAPSYMLHTASQQGKPHDAPPGRTTEFAALARFNGTLNEWLRSYF